MKLTIKELKEHDPKRYEREYYKWCEADHYQIDTQWVLEDFQQKYKPSGVHIEELHWNVSYSQGDYGSFDGRVFLAEWMAATKYSAEETYAEKFPALYLACDEDGSYLKIEGRQWRSRWYVDFNEHWYTVSPKGIFANLEEDAWDALVEDQASDADLEAEVREFCENIGQEIYDSIRDEYDEMTSYASFEEYCAWNELTFEVENEDEICSIN